MNSTTNAPSTEGRVVVNFGARCLVEDSGGQLIRCQYPRKLLRPVCGDLVRFAPIEGQSQGVLTEILPRRNELVRHDLRSNSRVLASNLDVVLVVLAAKPEPDLSLLDRYLVATEVLGLRPIIVFNKQDLLNTETHRQWTENLSDYGRLEYPVIWTSTTRGLGLDSIQAELRGCTGIVVGQSGVGKSSLVEALIPDLSVQVKALSEASGEGQHTTTSTRLYPLPGRCGFVIDSPGVRDFRLWPMPAAELAKGFPEIRSAESPCRFQDCIHLNEPDCTIKQLVEEGHMSQRRYHSYCQLLEWAAQQKDRRQ